MTGQKGFSRMWRGLIVLLVFLIIWFIPNPDGVTEQAWGLLAVFIATIIGLILQPLPMGAMVLLGVAATVVTGVRTAGEALSGFSNGVVWLIVLAFLLSRGFIKTGLGRRIAFLLIRAIGKSTLGLSYALAIADLIIAPATPSNTARAGGVIYPVAKSLAVSFGSEPGPSARRMGAFLMLTEYQVTLVTSAMFMTAMAANPLIVELSADALGVSLTWGSWALAALVPGVVCLLLIPFILYRIYPPEIKSSPEAPEMAKKELAGLGPMAMQEKVMLAVFVGAIFMWATDDGIVHSFGATAVALIAVAIMLLLRVLDWDDVLGEKGAWDALIWFGGLVMMAGALNTLGFIDWFSEQIAGSVAGWAMIPAFLVIALVYFYSHYGFASMTAHVTAMFIPFATVAIAAGVPPYMAALTLAYFSNLNAATTHYGTGPAPILFGSGYVDMSTWWKYGLIISFVTIGIWMTLGSAWWKVLGLW